MAAWVTRPYPVLEPQKPPARKAAWKPPVLHQYGVETGYDLREPLAYVKFSPVLGGSPYTSDRTKLTQSTDIPPDALVKTLDDALPQTEQHMDEHFTGKNRNGIMSLSTMLG